MTTKITRTGTTPTNTNKYTWSAWIKRGQVGVGESILYNYADGNNRGYIAFDASNKLFFYDKVGSEQNNCYSTRKLRDTFGWYHLHIKTDSTLGSDRFVVHINGVRETITGTTIDQNDTLGFKVATGSGQHSIGTNADSTANPFTGILSHVHYVDGLAIAHTEFGETDATTGEWKIKTSPTVSEYGANGYFILKDGNSLTDQSGKGNNFALATGTLTNTEDCPSDVFATWNNLHNGFESATYSCGNTKTTTGGSGKYTWNNSTLGMIAGKYYMELRWVSGGTDALFGITDRFSNNSTEELGNYATQYAYRNNGQIYTNNSGSAWGSTFAIGDIVGIAVDMDNNKLYFSKNGTWENSGDPTSGATGTGAVSISASPQNGCYYFSICGYDDASMVFEANFGNGYLGTTAVTSAGTNASGIGIFEYDVPTGYSALSTKGLNK